MKSLGHVIHIHKEFHKCIDHLFESLYVFGTGVVSIIVEMDFFGNGWLENFSSATSSAYQ